VWIGGSGINGQHGSSFYGDVRCAEDQVDIMHDALLSDLVLE